MNCLHDVTVTIYGKIYCNSCGYLMSQLTCEHVFGYAGVCVKCCARKTPTGVSMDKLEKLSNAGEPRPPLVEDKDFLVFKKEMYVGVEPKQRVFPDFDPKIHVIQRPSLDATMLRVANTLAQRGTCVRRRVACVLTDQWGRILATGFNGVARGQLHCIEFPCQGSTKPHGEGLAECGAIHAEQNALMQCREVMDISTCYVTCSPCMHCMKMLLNTSCERIVYLEVYDENALLFWTCAGRKAEKHEPV